MKTPRESLETLIADNQIDSFNVEAEHTVSGNGVIVKVRLTIFKSKLPQYATGFAFGEEEEVALVADKALAHAFYLIIANLI